MKITRFRKSNISHGKGQYGTNLPEELVVDGDEGKVAVIVDVLKICQW